MGAASGSVRELSVGEVVSKTFELYRKNLAEYLILFAVVEAVTSVLNFLVRRVFVLPSLPANPTSQQALAWFSGFIAALVPLVGLTFIVSNVFVPVAEGAAVKLASDEIANGTADLRASVGFAISKLLWIWALSIVLGVVLIIGFVALIVPGIILAIMFSLALPALLIENKGIGASMGRSRELVGHRWLKSLAVFLLMGLIILVAAAVVSSISAPFGSFSSIVSGILSASYQPLVPIVLVVYYYSNVARTAPPPPTQAPQPAPTTVLQSGTKFCPSCGAQLDAAAAFCSRCGARQPG